MTMNFMNALISKSVANLHRLKF